MFEKEIALGMTLFTDAAIEKINLLHLDMRDCRACVLGQLFGDFSDGLKRLHLHWADAEVFGFAVKPENTPDAANYLMYYRVLTFEWVVAIIDRKVERAADNAVRLTKSSMLADDLQALDEAMDGAMPEDIALMEATMNKEVDHARLPGQGDADPYSHSG